jgi:hypothetical protein
VGESVRQVESRAPREREAGLVMRVVHLAEVGGGRRRLGECSRPRCRWRGEPAPVFAGRPSALCLSLGAGAVLLEEKQPCCTTGRATATAAGEAQVVGEQHEAAPGVRALPRHASKRLLSTEKERREARAALLMMSPHLRASDHSPKPPAAGRSCRLLAMMG